MLTPIALARLDRCRHHICESTICPVVYFDDSGTVYRRSDVRIAVAWKEPSGNRTICYCFDETDVSLQIETDRMGGSSAVDRVRAHIEAGRCACDIRNPSGVCCLGQLAEAVRRLVTCHERPEV